MQSPRKRNYFSPLFNGLPARCRLRPAEAWLSWNQSAVPGNGGRDARTVPEPVIVVQVHSAPFGLLPEGCPPRTEMGEGRQ